MSFLNKVAIVTGSSSGIGAATAVLLAQAGCNVTITGRNADNLKRVRDECVSSGGKNENIHMIIGDLNDSNVQQSIVSETVKKFGKLDILVNNAGMAPAKDSVVNGSIDAYDEVFRTNVRCVITLTQHAIPHLVSTKGNIVNVSSVAGLRPSSSFVFYSMSKAAIDHFTKCLALELAPKQVRVNAVNPAAVATQLLTRDGSQFNAEQAKMMYQAMTASYPIGRIGEPVDVARAIAFLAHSDNSWLTGVTLPLDGASTLYSASAVIIKQGMEKMAQAGK